MKLRPALRLAPALWLPILASLTLIALGTHLTERAQAASNAGNQPALQAAASGDLSLSAFSLGSFFGAAPGLPVSYTLFYSWGGDGAAPNVQVSGQLPPEIDFTSASPPPSSRSGGQVAWNLGEVPNNTFGEIVVTGTVRADVQAGQTVTSTFTIAGDVSDSDTSNNQTAIGVKTVSAEPKLWLFKMGLLEEADSGSYYEAEKGVETTFDLSYFNMSIFPGVNAVLVDTLPAGLEYVSAEPAPSGVDGQRITWQLGDIGGYDYGQVKLRVRPTQTGQITNSAIITAGNRFTTTGSFTFDVVNLLPPRLLKPDISESWEEEPVILGAQPTFAGVAKAGGVVTLYEGKPEGCSGDFANCNPRAIGSAVAGSDRTWSLTPSAPLETRDYALYLRVEKDGESSQAQYGYWSPHFIRVDPRFEQAGFDLDNFKIDSGGQEVTPGAIGGRSGTTPNEDLKIQIRQKAPDSIATDPSLLETHALQLVVTEDGRRVTETLPVAQVTKVVTPTNSGGLSASDHFSSWDFIYVHKGFGPGSIVEIWCLPVFYSEDGIPIVGLVYVKCHEMVVDPAGYVYDRDKAGRDIPWPEKPADEYLIPNATVTATVRQGDNSYVRWRAEDYGQVNPQATDLKTADRILVNGYFAFYVPPGQYKVLATAPGCTPFESPVLTVVEEPVFYNVGMRCATSAAGQVLWNVYLPALDRASPANGY